MASVQHSWLPSLTKKHVPLFPSISKTSPFKISLCLNPSNAKPSNPTSPDPSKTPPEPGPVPSDRVRLAFEKAKAYKKSVEMSKKLNLERNSVDDSGGASIGNSGKSKKVPDSVKLALEKAKEYSKNKGVRVKVVAETETNSGLKRENEGNSGSALVDKSASNKETLSISGIDFMGLGFSDKKTGSGLPAGSIPVTDPFPEDYFPEVEIIVGDPSKFGNNTTPMPYPTPEDDSDVYKPKVSSWGVFPRPANISKTYGGGRNIRPGDVLETAEERAAKQERTRQLLAAYRKKIDPSVDPKLKLECEKVLKDGDSLMDSGKLNEALPYYEKVMDEMPFQSELHGLAALHWGICQDSLLRPSEARVMYKKLRTHVNDEVRKRARHFMFTFQAMEMMKVTGSNFLATNTGYRKYFDAFTIDKTIYFAGEAENDEGALSQALPYIIFLISPILIVLFIAVQRGNIHL